MAKRKYDVLFQTPDREEGFVSMPARGQDRDLTGSFGPAELQVEVAKSRDVPVLWRDFSGGAGFSESWGQGVNGYAYGRNVNTRNPRLLLPAAHLYNITVAGLTFTAPVTDSINFDGRLRFVAGDSIFSIDPASTAASLDNQFSGSLFKTMQIFPVAGVQRVYVTDYNGRMVVRKAGSWSRMADPGAVQPFHRMDDLAKVYWAVGDKRGYQLVGVASKYPTVSDAAGNYIYHCAGDPETAANWTPVGYVGSGYVVRSMAASNRRVYYCCDDGIYDLDEQGYSPNLTPYWGDYPHASNGQWSTVYEGLVLASHVLGLDYVPVSTGARLDASTMAHPGSGLPNETPVYGPVVCGINEGGWIVVAQFNGKDTYVSYGKPRDMIGINGPGPVLWHNEYYLAGQKVTHMAITERHGGPVLVLFSHAYNSTTAVKIWEAILPTSSTTIQDWLNNGRMRFSQSFDLFIPVEDWQDPASRKNLMRIDVQADGLGILQQGAVQVEVLAKTENQGWVSQGSSASSPRGIIYPQGKYLDGYRIGLQVKGTGVTTGLDPVANPTNVWTANQQSFPPIIRALKARAGLVVEQRKTRVYHLRVGGGELGDGTLDRRDPQELKDWLFSLQNYGPITAVNEDGKVETVKVETGASFIELEAKSAQVQVSTVELVCSVIEEQAGPTPTILEQYTGPTWGQESGAQWSATAPTITGGVKLDDGVTPTPPDIDWQE